MQNPYTPPESQNNYRPFPQRLRRAVGMAVSAYRKGMARDNVSRRERFVAWMTLLAIFVFGVSILLFAFRGLLDLVSRWSPMFG